ncbi:MAG: non-heme Fe2+,alpha-ketoglutarate-dependent halogenase [Gammaproteobacteria bacterium]|jgi:non-heme Fe2+,alpha-ketoglutarate-dependent halogenase
MNKLSIAAKKQFESEGYLSPTTILTDKEAQTYRSNLESFENKLGHPVQGPLRTKPHLLFKWVDDLMRHEKILDCIEDLIGPDILCWNSWFWIKEAHTSSFVSWHQDSQYWGLDTGKLVTAWLALSPASEASGCMNIIPGSHLGEAMPHVDLYHEDNLLTRGQEIVEIDESKAVAMPLKSGEMSFHNIGIAHASGLNQTSDRRIGLSFHYMPAGTQQLNADWDCASLVRGKDSFEYFEESPAPRFDQDPISVAHHKKATDAMRALLFKNADKIRSTI